MSSNQKQQSAFEVRRFDDDDDVDNDGAALSSSDALADALSSSLADIVASSAAARRGLLRSSACFSRPSPSSAMKRRRDDGHDAILSRKDGDPEVAAGHHSSEQGRGTTGEETQQQQSATWSADTSSSSSSSSGLDEANDCAAAVVTNATTGSSGDGGTSNKDSSSDSGARGPSKNNAPLAPFASSSLPDYRLPSSRGHHHHHHHYHHHNRGGVPASDGYGLPVPMDDSVLGTHGAAAEQPRHAAVVVAHRLPPPKTSSSDSAAASSSGGDSDRGNTGARSGQSYQPEALVQPLREPGFHTIRRTFHRVASRARSVKGGVAGASEEDSSRDAQDRAFPPHHKHKPLNKGKHEPSSLKLPPPSLPPTRAAEDAHCKKREAKKRKLSVQQQLHASLPPLPSSKAGSDNDESGGSSSSSSDGCGTDGGYAGSASSNENGSNHGGAGSCSSPSVSSSEDSDGNKHGGHHHHHKRLKGGAISAPRHSSTKDPTRPLLSQKRDSSLSMSSSEIADFSTESDEGEEARRGSFAAVFGEESSRSPSITSSDEQVAVERGFARASQRPEPSALASSRKRQAPGWPPLSSSPPGMAMTHLPKKRLDLRSKKATSLARGNLKSQFPTLDGKPPILAVGCDVMAHILTFLEPPAILDVLTMPLSKEWHHGFTCQPELWRVLCLLDPFKAQVDFQETDSSSSSSSDDDSLDSYRGSVELRRSVGTYRLLYTSFVRCLRYLSRIQEDAQNGRPPSLIDYGSRPLIPSHNIRDNENLQQFLARARGVVVRDREAEAAMDSSDISDDDNNNAAGHPGGDALPPAAAPEAAAASAIGVSDDGSSTSVPRSGSKNEGASKSKTAACKRKKRIKFGHSILTQRLLGPSADGTPGHSDLPWSCAIYSIVNWMVAFSDVEGIQTMCLKVLPSILEDEQQRMTAQRAGLTDIVLRGMVMFPDSTILHTAAFHTLVLLARPLGGQEGMIFNSSMVNASGIFSPDSGSSDGRNGIAVMLDSMRRFQDDEVLQAMGCWSLVNIALAPSQKEMLVKLGGIEVTANAMTIHPYSAEVQFRALFALINLVIPSVSANENPEEGGDGGGADAAIAVEDSSEKEVLEEMMDHLVNLVVLAMKNFCPSEAILNRACLVLHNLSLTEDFHEPLLLTPNCYNMLEWCLINFPLDLVLQQSTAAALHRLQTTLSSDETLRSRFYASQQQQQRDSLEQVHQEAILLSEQQAQRARGLVPMDASQ